MSMTPTFSDIDLSADGARGELHLNRPEKLNALRPETLRELAEAAAWLNTQPDLKVVIIAGRGRAFSAGADVDAFAERADADPGALRAAADAGRLMADAIERVAAVTIAKVHGHCVGGGLVLAAACDIRVAAEDTRFAIPEIDLGIPLAWGGVPRLVREVGPALTKELVMTCRSFDAAEAREVRFLNRVAAAEELDDAVAELAAALAEKPKLALLASKRHVNAITEQMVGTARSWSDADGLVAALGDPEGRESATRYLARMRGD